MKDSKSRSGEKGMSQKKGKDIKRKGKRADAR